MAITKDSIGTMALDEFVEAVAGIYNTQDKKRSIWDVWLHTVYHAASIGEEARKYKPGEALLREIADFSMWLFTFLGKIHGAMSPEVEGQRIEESLIRIDSTFSDLVWNKYPGICPVCFGRRNNSTATLANDLTIPCDCLLYPVETRDQSQIRSHIQTLRRYATEHKDQKPQSVDQWQQMFQSIYEANLRHLSLIDIVFHLLEEVGEVSYAMVGMYTHDRQKLHKDDPKWRQTSLENEIADVCSWLFTLVTHLESIGDIARAHQKYLFGVTVLQDTKITLSGIIWSRYGSNDLNSLYCPHACKKPVCECPILLVCDKDGLATLRSVQ